MATIKDVARYANVAPSTVSFVLNGSRNVTPQTRRRVLDAVTALKYQPNNAARSLKIKHTSTIGVVVPDITNPFFTEIVSGIEDTCAEQGYSIILANSAEDPKREQISLRVLSSRDIDGLILIGTGVETDYSYLDFPIIIVDRKVSNNYTTVLVDNKKGAFMATDHLLQIDHSANVLLITGDLHTSTYSDRLIGYIEALGKYNIPYDASYVLTCPINASSGYAAIQKAFKKGLQFNSVFAANDLLAFGAIRAMHNHKITIPQEMRIVGFDDVPTSSFIWPSLTTIHQPQREMGHVAAKELLSKIKGNEDSEPHEIILEPSLIIRESTSIDQGVFLKQE